MTGDDSVQHTVLRHTDVGFAITDSRGRLRWVNTAMAELLGIDEAHARGRSLPALLPAAWEGTEGTSTVQRLTTTNRGVRWLEINWHPLPPSDAQLCRVVDLTASRQEELEVGSETTRRSPERSRMGNWEWIIAEDRVVWSEGMREMSGYPADADIDYDAFMRMIHPDDVALVTRVLTRSLNTGEPFTYIHRARGADRTDVRVFECFGEVISDDDGKPVRLVGSAHDITQAHEVHHELRRMAEEDPLTGLPNRRALTARLEREIASGAPGALVVIDLDNFKDVNDLRGHMVGDRVMCALATALRNRLPENHYLGRLGGDEFAVVMPGVDPVLAKRTAQQLAAAVATIPVAVAGVTIRVTVSTGVAPFDSGPTWEAVLANADLALYASKGGGRNRVTVYDPGHYANTAKRVAVLERLRTALTDGHLALHGMPMVDLRTGRTLGYELLLRLEDDLLPPLGPGDFLPDAERTDLILNIDRWVLGQAVDTLAAHPDPGLRLDVNVSGRTLDDEEFGDFVLDRIRSSDVSPGRLGLEITETAALTNLDAARHLATRLREAGCRITLDDFGSGFGSFVHLKHLPITGLKIDGEFVRGIDRSTTDSVLVTGIMEIANGLGLTTVAEWVERPSQVNALTRLGVEVAQGFHLGKPKPLSAIVLRPNGVLPR